MSIETRNYEIVKKQEALLTFSHFDNESAWELGNIIVEYAREKEMCIRDRSTVGAGKRFVDLFCTYGLYFIFIVLIIFFAVQRPNFFSVSNFLLILKSSSVLGIAVVGMFFVLIVAGIDISVSMNMYFSAVIGATVLNSMELPLIVCFLAAGVSGLLIRCV